MSHCPSSPTSTGQVPTLWQLGRQLAERLRRSQQRNKSAHPARPGRCGSRPANCSKASSRLSLGQLRNGVVLRTRTLILNSPSSTLSAMISTAPQSGFRSRTITPTICPAPSRRYSNCFSAGKLKASGTSRSQRFHVAHRQTHFALDGLLPGLVNATVHCKSLHQAKLLALRPATTRCGLVSCRRCAPPVAGTGLGLPARSCELPSTRHSVCMVQASLPFCASL